MLRLRSRRPAWKIPAALSRAVHSQTGVGHPPLGRIMNRPPPPQAPEAGGTPSTTVAHGAHQHPHRLAPLAHPPGLPVARVAQRGGPAGVGLHTSPCRFGRSLVPMAMMANSVAVRRGSTAPCPTPSRYRNRGRDAGRAPFPGRTTHATLVDQASQDHLLPGKPAQQRPRFMRNCQKKRHRGPVPWKNRLCDGQGGEPSVAKHISKGIVSSNQMFELKDCSQGPIYPTGVKSASWQRD